MAPLPASSSLVHLRFPSQVGGPSLCVGREGTPCKQQTPPSFRPRIRPRFPEFGFPGQELQSSFSATGSAKPHSCEGTLRTVLTPVVCCREAVDGAASGGVGSPRVEGAGIGMGVSGTSHFLTVCCHAEDRLRLLPRLTFTGTFTKSRPLTTILQKWILRVCNMPLIVCLPEPGFKARCVRLHQSAKHVWI